MAYALNRGYLSLSGTVFQFQAQGGENMDLTGRQKAEIEKIMASMDCPGNFKCFKSDFQNMCKAEYNGLGDFANCLEKRGTLCKFRLPFGFAIFCTCPLRVYIAKELGM